MNDRIPSTPLVRCFLIKASPPSLEDNTADIDRLKHGVQNVLQEEGISGRHILVPHTRTAAVAAGFRSAGFRGHVLVNILPAYIEIVDFFREPPAFIPAVALDLGTTHLEATLLDLRTGDRIARSHKENRQIEFGPDILTRIHHAAPSGRGDAPYSELQGLQQLRNSVVATVNDLIHDLAAQGAMDQNAIRSLSVAGNTTMTHLFLGFNPYYICREPYIPLVNEPDPCHAGELGIDIFPMAPVWVLPSIGSYFGGDLIAGILATGIDEADEICMLIDVGTNAEVVLGSRDWLIACAGAAGPALEGGVAKMGMRAGPGAVERVVIDTGTWDLALKTIDDVPPRGICGSGLIDLAAQLYLAGIIDFSGRFRKEDQPKSTEHRQFLQQRLRRDAEGLYFIVAFPEETGSGRPVILTQADLDALMRSKAAMYAVLTTLVAQVGVDFGILRKIYVAGAFGKHIDPQHAVTLGMLPDLPLATYETIGNSSLMGAELVLLSERNRRRSGRIRRIVTYLELNVNQDFMIRFSGARFIPHSDTSLFPSVPVFHKDSGNISG
ncbi:MAG: ASKHA domain-containing protein [Desulfobulbaceae bacterium]|nr:ASKHA domain-containing protein [Desulfobulbaceae bacterium]